MTSIIATLFALFAGLFFAPESRFYRLRRRLPSPRVVYVWRPTRPGGAASFWKAVKALCGPKLNGFVAFGGPA